MTKHTGISIRLMMVTVGTLMINGCDRPSPTGNAAPSPGSASATPTAEAQPADVSKTADVKVSVPDALNELDQLAQRSLELQQQLNDVLAKRAIDPDGKARDKSRHDQQ